ncbi:MAG: YdcF family protein [Anaerolineae bacterium]|nr:YdcF family protein [Anaerolineae bacterium]
MFNFLSKLLPLFVYPLGFSCFLLGLALCLRRRPQWQTRLVAVVLAVLWLGGNRIVAMVLTRSLEWRYLPPSDVPRADVIVVLGGGTRTQAYPRSTHEVDDAGDRLLYAAWLYQHGAAPYILVSGGRAEWVGPAGKNAEAEVMAELLTLMSVPREAIWLEETSRNTYENAMESYKILEAEDVKDLILVTSAMHMPRAYGLFARPGFTVIPAPTDFFVTQDDWDFYTQPKLEVQVFNLLPSSSDLRLTSKVMKEYIGMVVYKLRGWL